MHDITLVTIDKGTMTLVVEAARLQGITPSEYVHRAVYQKLRDDFERVVDEHLKANPGDQATRR